MITKELNFPRGDPLKALKRKNRDASSATKSSSEEKPKSSQDSQKQDYLFKSGKKSQVGDDTTQQGGESIRPKKMKKRERRVEFSGDTDEAANQKGIKSRVVIDELTSSKLREGMVLLGVIQEISDFSIKICLPGGSFCTVPITNISSPYTQVLHQITQDPDTADAVAAKPASFLFVGQSLPVRIMEMVTHDGGKLEIIASIAPNHVNSNISRRQLEGLEHFILSGAVESIEDHGCVIDIGLRGMKGFLPHDESKPHVRGGQLHVGQVLFCALAEPVPAGDAKDQEGELRTVRLTLKPKVLNKKKITERGQLAVSGLLPGNRVDALITNVVSRGLVLSLFGQFTGFISRHHLASPWDSPEDLQSYISTAITATVLYVNPATKQVALSARPRPDPEMIKNNLMGTTVGQQIPEVQVVERQGGVLMVTLPGGVKGIVPYGHLKDDEQTNNEKKKTTNQMDDDEEDLSIKQTFAPGTKHPAKILSVNIVDLYVRVSLKPSLASPADGIVTLEELTIGKVVKVTPLKTCNGGILARIGTLRAFIPEIHFPGKHFCDIHAAMEHEKPVRARILRLNTSVQPPKISLTCRKELLNLGLTLIDSYKSSKPGITSSGVVVHTNDSGVLVEFFNGVKGYAPQKFATLKPTSEMAKLFPVGMIIDCTVVSCDVANEKLKITFLNATKGKKTSSQTSNPLQKLTIGKVLQNLQIVSKQRDGFLLYDSESEANVYLPAVHLSDDPFAADKIFKGTEEGEILDTALVLKVTPTKVFVTRKQSFMDSLTADTLPTTVKDLTVGMVYPGFVTGVTDFGVFIELPNQLKGLVPRSHLKDEGSIFPSQLGLKIGQTVRAKLIKKEETGQQQDEDSSSHAKQRAKLTFSMKESDLVKKEGGSQAASDLLELISVRKRTRSGTEQVTKMLKKKKPERQTLLGDVSLNWNAKQPESSSAAEQEGDTQETDGGKDGAISKTGKNKSEVKSAEIYDLENKLKSNANDSKLWLKYISLHLDDGELERARAVAERAMTSINFRLDSDKLAIWLVMLNMENSHGSAETLQAVYDRALASADQLQIHQHMAVLYADTPGKEQEAEAVHLTLTKRFKANPQVWINFGAFYMTQFIPPRLDAARKLMQRALITVDKRHHVLLISKYAQLEFKHGDLERGKTLFEDLLVSYPRRTDLWLVYIDMMIKYSFPAQDGSEPSDDQLEAVRNILERAVSLKLADKKMGVLFKRYLTFEQDYGNEGSVKRVREKALKYVQS